MTTDPSRPAHWHTASFGDRPDTTPVELDALGAHLGHCRGRHARWFAARCVLDAVHRFVASRVVSTLVIATLLLAVVSIVG